VRVRLHTGIFLLTFIVDRAFLLPTVTSMLTTQVIRVAFVLSSNFNCLLAFVGLRGVLEVEGLGELSDLLRQIIHLRHCILLN